MFYANVDGAKRLASPGLTGNCPLCNGKVHAKCGEIVSWHWAHETKDCDIWTEPESEWHRQWKGRFPIEWQEVGMGRTENKFLHRADILTPHGLVVEFQNSNITPKDISDREKFYTQDHRLVWVLNGEGFNVRSVNGSDWSTREEYMYAIEAPGPMLPELDRFNPTLDDVYWAETRLKQIKRDGNLDDILDRYLEALAQCKIATEKKVAENERIERVKNYAKSGSSFRWSHGRPSWMWAANPVFIDFSGKGIWRVKKLTRDAGKDRTGMVIHVQKRESEESFVRMVTDGTLASSLQTWFPLHLPMQPADVNLHY